MNLLTNKRITLELKKIDEDLDNNKYKYIVGYYRNEKELIFYIDVLSGFILINFYFQDSNYPFKCPKIMLGNEKKFNYHKLLNDSHIKINKLLNESNDYYFAKLLDISNKYYEKIFNPNNCLCCTSLLCPSRWNPTINILLLIKEIYNNYHFVDKIKKMIYAKVIMRKYLNMTLTVIYDFL